MGQITVYFSEKISQEAIERVVSVIKNSVRRDSGTEPKVEVSNVKVSSGISVVMSDFGNLDGKKAQDIMNFMGIEVVNAAMLKRHNLKITMHVALVCEM